MKPFLIGHGETDLKRSDLHEAAQLVSGRAASDPTSPGSWTRGLRSALCWPETCLPSSHACEGEDHRKYSDSKGGEGRNSLCREDCAALDIFSLGVSRSFAKGMGRAADEKV